MADKTFASYNSAMNAGKYCIGIDEVGRGCWAGPLVAAAVLLPTDFQPPAGGWRLGDSKQLSAAARRRAAEGLRQANVPTGLGWVEPAEVDTLGLTASVRLAMQRALAGIDDTSAPIIVDGSYNFLADEPRATCFVRADAIVSAVGAASIVAKVARDDWMQTVAANTYPLYGFTNHVGYGTAGHRAALERHGVTPLHRRSYRPVRELLK